MVARREVPGGAHRRGDEIVRDRLRLQHGEIVLGLQADDLGLGLEAVGEDHLDALGAGHDVQVGEDDPLVDDHHAAADAVLDFLVADLVEAQSLHPHDRRRG